VKYPFFTPTNIKLYFTHRGIHGDIKRKTEAQAIFLNPFTVCSWCKRKVVICLFVDQETNGSYLFANGLNGLNGLYGLAHLHLHTAAACYIYSVCQLLTAIQLLPATQLFSAVNLPAAACFTAGACTTATVSCYLLHICMYS
jgi:hypothetical protein